MSWTDIFPVLDDAMVLEFQATATGEEREELSNWFAVQRVENRRDVKHIVSLSLFWKNIRSDQPDIVVKDRAMFMMAGRRRKLLRFDPWEHYAEPLIKGALWLKIHRPDVVFRVYLASDLVFLLPDLVAADCEVHLMKSASIRHNPGAMWRFLAFEEMDKLVTLMDADRAAVPMADIVRTETTEKAGLGFWRVPVWGGLNDVTSLNYRPIVGCQMGSVKPFPTRLLMEALIWQTRRGGISKQAKLPCSIPVTVYGTEWPDYGFDEWFLLAALYPRAAFGGLLTFVPVGAKSELMPLDIEYTMWANPSSEIQYFGWADGRAAGAIRSKHRLVKVRQDCAVVMTSSMGKMKLQAKKEWSIVFDDPAPPVIAAKRNWIKSLELAVEAGKSKWLAVIMEGFEPSIGGAELFLERRLEGCDAAHSGYAFAMLKAEVVGWARRQKLDSLVWQQGQPVKYPKLSGPLTLWRRSFLRALLKEWNASGMAVPLEMFLAGWAEKGRAKLVNTSSAAQGWKAVRATSSK